MDRQTHHGTPRPKRTQPRGSQTTRAIVFAGLAIAILGLAVVLTRPRELTAAGGDNVAAPVDVEVRIDMSGFAPAELRVPAGRAVRIRVVNPDSSMHSDGGGIHGFTVPELGIDARVQPLTKQVITIPAAAPGDYVFYCDTCCGGKENPSMQGHIAVRG